MKQWIPLKIVLITGLLMLVQYFVPHESFEFIYEYSIDFIIIIGIFAMVLGIWSLVRVTYEKIKRKAPGYFYSWVTLIGLTMMLFFGFFPFGIDSMRIGNIGDIPHAVAVGDVDFDNDNDIITANWKSNNVSIFKNKGDGQFISAYTYPAGKNPRALVLCDIDTDNDPDIIVSNESTGEISVLVNESKPTDFARKKLQITSDKKIDSLMNAGKPKFAKPFKYKAGEIPGAIACGDLDGDGRVNDIAVANQGSNDISLFMNLGDGSFAEAVSLPVGFGASGIYAADLNHDYTNDIVAVSGQSGEIALLYGDGKGNFTLAEKMTVEAARLGGVATGDFDQNGYFDLAVAALDEANAGSLIILKSDSSGFFSQSEIFGTGMMPVSLSAVDLDEDGSRDLVVTCQGQNTLFVHHNDGQGGFAESERLFAGRVPIHTAVGALSKTGRPALIVANQGGNNVATFTNMGSMSFKPGDLLASGDILFIGGELANYLYRQLFLNIMIPIQATMFSLLAFYIASAAYRSFRARSLLASILLLAALIIMIRFAPLGPLSGAVSDLSSWILKVPNMAAKRAIFIGVGLGMVATAIKVLLGIERTYMGRD